MTVESLFDDREVAGVFRGFVEGGMEFHADLSLPYRGAILNNRPLHGAYLLIELENPNEAVLGRITTVSSEGKLATGAGEDYNIRAAKSGREVPETLKEEYLKYRVNVRVLGGLKLEDGKIVFVPSFRRVPSVGAPVCFPSNGVLRALAGSEGAGVPIGLYALGEYIYAGDKAAEYGLREPWMQIMSPEIDVRFDVNALVSRRTFVFARAGFGKSNLNKLLFSQLYKTAPMKRKGDRLVPVGTVIFDRDGEYFWPDDNGRPGLCDIEELRNNIVVFTNRQAPSPYYGSFVTERVKFDLREMDPAKVISLAVSQDRQEQQNIKKLKSVSRENWKELIDLVYTDRYGADMTKVKSLLNISNESTSTDAEANAALSNITNVVTMLHDPNSHFLRLLMTALRDGKLCIVDMSTFGTDAAFITSGIVLDSIFDYNQEEFTKAHSKGIPTIAVLEEAQSVLSPGKSATAPFIRWVKEGRKYDLGALMITQQPGSIQTDILSQGDNWFVFHLLCEKDLQDVKRANAHFSDDLLSSLLNEPIVGQGVFWSSVKSAEDGSLKPYPIPIRIFDFQKSVRIINRSASSDAVTTYASELRKKIAEMDHIKSDSETGIDMRPADDIHTAENPPSGRDNLVKEVAENFRNNPEMMSEFESGISWWQVKENIKSLLPDSEFDKEKTAFKMVAPVLNEMFGKQYEGWHTEDIIVNGQKRKMIRIGKKAR